MKWLSTVRGSGKRLKRATKLIAKKEELEMGNGRAGRAGLDPLTWWAVSNLAFKGDGQGNGGPA